MRSLPVLVMLAAFLAPLQACGGTRASGPAWPKQTDPESDGGESLAPRKGGVVALDTSEPEAPAEPAAASTPAKPEPADAAAPAATPPEAPAAATSEEDDEELVITTEDIVIEIDDE